MTFALVGLWGLLWAGAPDTLSTPSRPALLHGKVVEYGSGRLLPEAEIRLASAGNGQEILSRSDASGHFQLGPLSPGEYHLQSQVQGHIPLAFDLHVDAGADQDLSVTLHTRAAARVESVTVEGNLLSEALTADAIDRVSLAGDNLKNLTTVLADDPLRAVQALPGVTANDDFNAQFSLRGADFSRIGIYLDGIKLHNAVHSLEGSDLSGSASSFNAALVRQLDLYEGSYSEKYGDSSAGVLDVHLRDGDPDRYSFKLAANLGTAGLTLGGPMGAYRRCVWLAGYRKSYLQYLLARTTTDPSMAFGIEDAQGRATCHVSSTSTLSLELIDSHTNLDRSSKQALLGANALMLIDQHVLTGNLSWIYSPSDRLQVATHAAWMQDRFAARNPYLRPLGEGGYHEKTANTNVTWLPTQKHSVTAGFSLRALGEDGFTETYNQLRSIRQYNRYRRTGYLAGGYAGEAWNGLHDRLHVATTVRWDRHSVDQVTAVSPQAGLTLRLVGSLNLQLGWGQYVQFPELSVLGSNLGNPYLLPIRSMQTTAALDTRLPAHFRLKLGVYQRNDRDIPYQPYSDPRLINGRVLVPPITALFANSLRGRSRGAEVYLQRSFSSGLGGWVSYNYGKTYMHEGLSGTAFPSDWDQRHTLNAFVSYPIRPSVNVSAHWNYGSGFPAPGFLQLLGGNYYLAGERNQLRIGPYQRIDVRVNKEWRREKWKKSLYIEVMNLSNKANYRFGSLDGYNPVDRRAYVTVDSLFPILPSVGFVLER